MEMDGGWGGGGGALNVIHALGVTLDGLEIDPDEYRDSVELAIQMEVSEQWQLRKLQWGAAAIDFPEVGTATLALSLNDEFIDSSDFERLPGVAGFTMDSLEVAPPGIPLTFGLILQCPIGTDQFDTLFCDGDGTGGTYELNVEGETTSVLNADDDEPTVTAAIEALPGRSPGDVVLSGGADILGGFDVHWQGTLAGQTVAFSATTITPGVDGTFDVANNIPSEPGITDPFTIDRAVLVAEYVEL